MKFFQTRTLKELMTLFFICGSLVVLAATKGVACDPLEYGGYEGDPNFGCTEFMSLTGQREVVVNRKTSDAKVISTTSSWGESGTSFNDHEIIIHDGTTLMVGQNSQGLGGETAFSGYDSNYSEDFSPDSYY